MKLIYILVSTLMVSACAPKPLELGAECVEVSTESQPNGCKLVAQVIGSAGNFITGEFTSNENLEIGALNDLRNKANRLNANYVKLISNRASQSGSFSMSQGAGSGSTSQVTVTYVGNAYICKEHSND